jgi:hypothetical protein
MRSQIWRSRPSRFVESADSELLRDRVVLFDRLAVSAMLIVTVRMSPTWVARWSLKKARAPGRHSEFAWRSTGMGCGIGIVTAACFAAGFSIFESFGSSPTCDRRVKVLQAESEVATSRTATRRRAVDWRVICVFLS